VGSRVRAPGQGVGGKASLKLKAFLAFQRPMKAAKFTPVTAVSGKRVCDVSTTLNRILNTSLMRTG